MNEHGYFYKYKVKVKKWCKLPVNNRGDRKTLTTSIGMQSISRSRLMARLPILQINDQKTKQKKQQNSRAITGPSPCHTEPP